MIRSSPFNDLPPDGGNYKPSETAASLLSPKTDTEKRKENQNESNKNDGNDVVRDCLCRH